MKYILSYPRSGNHLVRFISEFVTGGYTQGCINNIKDKPIYQNTFKVEGVMSHVDPNKEIAIKAHSVDEISQSMVRNLIPNSGVLSCIRNPFYCIASHIRGKRNVPLEEFKVELEKEIEHYKSLFILSYKSSVITTLWYEDLLEDNRYRSLSKIANFYKDDLDIYKYTLMCENPDYYFDVSAGGEGRTWGGSKSLNEKCFHIENLNKQNKKYFIERIKSFCNFQIKSLTTMETKYSKIKESKYIEKLNEYLLEVNDLVLKIKH